MAVYVVFSNGRIAGGRFAVFKTLKECEEYMEDNNLKTWKSDGTQQYEVIHQSYTGTYYRQLCDLSLDCVIVKCRGLKGDS